MVVTSVILGFLYPCFGGHLIEADIENSGLGPLLGLENLDCVGGDETGDFAFGVGHVSKHAGPAGTGVDTRRHHPAAPPVKAEGAFLHDFLDGVHVPGVVRTGGHAILAADAAVLVDHDDAVGPAVGRFHGAHAQASGTLAVVAQAGDEDTPYVGVRPFLYGLDPGPVDSEGNIVFTLAGNGAGVTAQAAPQVNEHGVAFAFFLGTIPFHDYFPFSERFFPCAPKACQLQAANSATANKIPPNVKKILNQVTGSSFHGLRVTLSSGGCPQRKRIAVPS